MEEYEDKKKAPCDITDWTKASASDAPQQSNGSDCGVYVLKNVECIIRGVKLDYSPQDILAYRREIAKEFILHSDKKL